VTSVEVTIENCLPEFGEILPDAEGGWQYFPNFGETISNIYYRSRTISTEKTEKNI